MTVSKSVLTLSTLAFALMFGGGVYILMHLNTLARPLTERIASEAMGVKVSIDSLDISLKDKRVSVRGVHVANPKGYSNPYAIVIGKADVALNSVGEKLIDFKDIIVHDTEVFVEVKENGTNLNALQKGMKGADKPANENPLKVIIRRFILNGAKIYPSVTLLSEKTLDPVSFHPVELRGVGERENGVLAQEAVSQVMQPLLQSFSSEAMDAGFYKGMDAQALKDMGIGDLQQFKNQLKDDAGKLGDSLKKMFD